jgi:hypothetical protein
MLPALFIPLMNGSGYYALFSCMPTFMSSELRDGHAATTPTEYRAGKYRTHG